MAESSPDEMTDSGAVLLSNGIMGIVQPAVERLDSHVHAALASQYTLNMHIRELAQYLKEISEEQQAPYDLDLYVRKLDNSKKRVTAIGNVLQNVHDRLSRLQRNIARQAYQQKQRIVQPLPSPPNR
ncbi:SNARE-associated protein Snapin [Loa loa]|uniref:Biogenesis of lysosome-related organelles complex 1 subunit 7 n=1 Tax=Loa loa TaxID=7209 RepID=A0A1S0U870_LOALO|nr:SNARE-associated protein Snapin [Loa loa]EFO25879.2 SNARE-associated protein Snapin [Loa loa]